MKHHERSCSNLKIFSYRLFHHYLIFPLYFSLLTYSKGKKGDSKKAWKRAGETKVVKEFEDTIQKEKRQWRLEEKETKWETKRETKQNELIDIIASDQAVEESSLFSQKEWPGLPVVVSIHLWPLMVKDVLYFSVKLLET